jgi:hypothetical protein
VSGSKKTVVHVTVLFCSNMSGTDKRELSFFIGKRAKPRCFIGISMNSLPSIVCANKNAWMTCVMTNYLGRRITTEIEENFVGS